MAPLRLVLFLLLPAAAASAAVDAGLLDLVAPEATMLAGIRVQAALASPLGKLAFAQMQSAGAGPGQPGRILQDFAAATGFDLASGLQEILIVTTGDRVTTPSNVVLLRGAFDPAKFSVFASKAGLATSTVNGTAVIQVDAATSVALLDSTTVAVAPVPFLTRVLERRAAGEHFSGALARRALAASGTGELWFATATPLSQLVDTSLGNVPIPFLESIRELSTNIGLAADGVTITGELLTRSGQEAQSIAAGLTLMTTLSRTPDTDFLRQAQFSTEGALVRIALKIPEAQAERLLAPAAGARIAAAPR